MRIGVVVGSVREVRRGAEIGAWLVARAAARDDGITYELIDLRDFDLPMFSAPRSPMALDRAYDDARVRTWSAAVEACDAYVFVTPEYNHGVPGAFKNAVDHLGPEWVGKAIAFVGYGSVGGVRAIEQWRTIMANFRMVDIRAELNIQLFFEVVDGAFSPAERRAAEVDALLEDLIAQARRQQH
ncbi:MAG: NADPH-dependent FMN reductase [Propioniciclava sp.]